MIVKFYGPKTGLHKCGLLHVDRGRGWLRICCRQYRVFVMRESA